MCEEDFLPAILAAPRDTFPRSAFGDWLEDQGEYERADFIRTCPTFIHKRVGYGRWEFTHDRFGKDDPWSCGLHFSFRGAARKVLPITVRRDLRSYRVRGGFVERVECSTHAWFHHAPFLLSRHPVWHLTLTDYPWLSVGEADHEGRRVCEAEAVYNPYAGTGEYELEGLLDPVGRQDEIVRMLFARAFPGVELARLPTYRPQAWHGGRLVDVTERRTGVQGKRYHDRPDHDGRGTVYERNGTRVVVGDDSFQQRLIDRYNGRVAAGPGRGR